MRFLVIAKDQYGAPRAWGVADTAIGARAECQAQAREYARDRPDLRLRIGPPRVVGIERPRD